MAKIQNVATLTMNERNVLVLLVERNSVREIADDLNLSAKIIRARKRSLMCKLGIHGRRQLTCWAVENGIVVVPGVPIDPVF
jgi:DNA-binding NarL/FixJ family response regulator